MVLWDLLTFTPGLKDKQKHLPTFKISLSLLFGQYLYVNISNKLLKLEHKICKMI